MSEVNELEAIRARHKGLEREAFSGSQAHADRATLLRLLDAAREELREAEAKLAKRLEADMFWDYDGAERPYDSFEELIQEREYEGEGIVEVQEAVHLPNAAYVYRIINDPEADDETIIERLSDEDYKHYRAAMSVATGARAMWSQMVDNLAAKLFEENPSPLHAWMHGKPWSSIDYNYKKHHRSLAHERLAAALKDQKP